MEKPRNIFDGLDGARGKRDLDVIHVEPHAASAKRCVQWVRIDLPPIQMEPKFQVRVAFPELGHAPSTQHFAVAPPLLEHLSAVGEPLHLFCPRLQTETHAAFIKRRDSRTALAHQPTIHRCNALQPVARLNRYHLGIIIVNRRNSSQIPAASLSIARQISARPAHDPKTTCAAEAWMLVKLNVIGCALLAVQLLNGLWTAVGKN